MKRPRIDSSVERGCFASHAVKSCTSNPSGDNEADPKQSLGVAKLTILSLEEEIRRLRIQLIDQKKAGDAEIERLQELITVEAHEAEKAREKDDAQRKDAQGREWRQFFVQSEIFKIHVEPLLDFEWRAILSEACGTAISTPKDRIVKKKMATREIVRTLPLLKFAIARGYLPSENTLARAAEHGNMDVIRFLCKHKCPWTSMACSEAAKEGHLDVLKYLREKWCPWDERASAWAVKSGRLEVLKYLRENGCPWDVRVCRIAAGHGRLDVVKYAHENGCPWDKETCCRAAIGGHLDVLKYLHENGCPWDERTCSKAALGGQMGVLKYVHENGCPWDEWTCTQAAMGGHLDVLKFARQHGCSWDEGTFAAASYGSHTAVIRWALDKQCPLFEKKEDVDDWLVQYGSTLFDGGLSRNRNKDDDPEQTEQECYHAVVTALGLDKNGTGMRPSRCLLEGDEDDAWR